MRLANSPQWYLIPPQDINMRVPHSITKCVVFIGTETANPAEPIKWRATGFFVSFPSTLASASSPNRGFMYLVTSKHGVRKLEGGDFYIRANTKDGKSKTFRVMKDHKWWFHQDPVCPADVAVFPIWQEDFISLLDYESIKATMFLTDETIENKSVGVGDEVFVVGLFSKHTGKEKNLPIIRTGNIAMMSDEPIPTTLFGNIEAYLVEMHSIGGLSGSPVFVLKPVPLVVATESETSFVMTSTSQLFLLGLIHGHWDVEADEIVDEDAEKSGVKSSVNVGIAIIVPAKKILETLNCKELVEYRAKAEAAYNAKHSPTPD
jgi:hypothetical protein